MGEREKERLGFKEFVRKESKKTRRDYEERHVPIFSFITILYYVYYQTKMIAISPTYITISLHIQRFGMR